MDIFVGSLPFKLNESGLREIFEKFGEVSSVSIIINKATHMKKGFGFVVMPDDTQALAAINALNGTEVMGRSIEVKQSEEKREAPKRSVKRKVTTNNEVKKNDTQPYLWPRKLYPKKKKPSIVDYPATDRKKEEKEKERLIKGAKNFKVGRRKKH